MKKNRTLEGRILGRRLARELTRAELEQADGSAASKQAAADGVSTWTLTYPADGPYNDSPPTGPIYT